MVRRRTKSFAATLAILMLVMSSVFTGAVTAESGAPDSSVDAPRALQATPISGDYVCKSKYTNQLRYTPGPTCSASEQLIQISASLPFDYCYSLYTGALSDDLPGDTCPYRSVYVEIDGLSSFFVCMNPYTGRLNQVSSLADCTGVPLFFIDLRGEIRKYACVEENLNPYLCDQFPAGGSQNEIRQLKPLVNTAGGFIDCKFKYKFNGVTSAAQYSCLNSANMLPAGIQAGLESVIGAGNVIVTAVDPGEHWSTAFDDFNTPEDESTAIRVEFTGAFAGQDVVPPIEIVNISSTAGGQEATVIDGSANSPGLNNVMPGGTVQIFEAPAGTDPNNPATYGPEVTAGPQAVDASGKFDIVDLFEGDYVVCADGTNSIAPSCEIVTINSNALTIVNNVDLPGMISAAITDTVGGNEVQSYDDIPFGGLAVTGGTYTITFDGVGPSAVLAYDATAAQIQTALEGLGNIDPGDVSVTGGPPPLFGPAIVIEFTGQYAGLDVPQIVINSSLTGTGGAARTWFFDPNLTDHDGFGTTQTLTADARVSGGTFTLSYNNGVTNSTTSPLDFDATVNEIEAALNLLPSIAAGGGSVQVSSSSPGIIPGSESITKAPVLVSFVNVMNSDTNVLVVDNTNLE
jgi:hypothetical protein